MRICLISGEFPPMQGGVGDYTRELGQAMADLGHEVAILTSRQAAGAGPCRGCRVFPLIDRWSWHAWPMATGLFDAQRTDIVNIQYQTAAYGMAPAINLLPWRMRLRRESPALVVTYHDLLEPYLFRGAGPLRRWITDTLARGCDGVIATNEEDDAELGRRFPESSRRLVPIGPNVLPSSTIGYDREAWRARWDIRPTQTVFSYFGFLNQSKGGEELVQALHRLVESGRDAILLMVGGKVGASDSTNFAYLRRVEELIDSLGLTERVIWTDYLPGSDVTAALMASDMCVLPYRDGASTRRGTLMAALVHGLPVVTTTPRVPVDCFRHEENMYLVPPRDPDALARAMARLADEPGLRAQLGVGASELARRFTWPEIATATIQFYTELLSKRTG